MGGRWGHEIAEFLPAALVGGGSVGAVYCNISLHSPSTQAPLSELQCVPSSTSPAGE